MAADLSAIVLGYRSGESLLDVLEPLHSLLSEADVEFELVVVANYWPGRDDTTPDVARRFAERRPGTVVLAEPKAGAMGWDMKRGLAAASGDYLVVIDGDAQNPVEDVLRMYQAMRGRNVDVMKGRRTLRHDVPTGVSSHSVTTCCFGCSSGPAASGTSTASRRG